SLERLQLPGHQGYASSRPRGYVRVVRKCAELAPHDRVQKLSVPGASPAQSGRDLRKWDFAAHDSTWRKSPTLCSRTKESVWTNRRAANVRELDRDISPTGDR